MKTESILSRVNEIMHNFSDMPVTAYEQLQMLSNDLAEQVRKEIAASRVETSAFKPITAMLKECKKSSKFRKTMHYAWTDKDGRQCICDGCRAFRLNEALPLEERPADAGDPLNLDKIFPDISTEYTAIPLPSAKEVKAFIALERAAKGRKEILRWDFGKGKPVVNASYLLDLLNILPDAKEIYYKNLVAPLYAKSERGDAILLPIRLAEKNAE